MPVLDIMDTYNDARKKGLRAMRAAQAEGTYPYLPALDEMLGAEGERLSQKNLGVKEIPLDMVVGTKTKGRQNSFACNFMPILEFDTEFGMKWGKVYNYHMEVGISDPIKCYEYMKKFYVLEGNKRVSVLKSLDMPSVDAEVIRIMPERTDERDVQLYYEFVDFYNLCPVYEVDFSHPGGYKKFVELLGLSETEPWPEDTVRMVEAGYYRFKRVFDAKFPNGIKDLTMAEALLVYLSVYSMESIFDQPRPVIERRIERLTEEFYSQVNEENIALQKAPAPHAEANRGFFANFFSAPVAYSERHPLKAAFLYTKTPETSSWINDQEIGRIYLNHRFEGLIETRAYFNCDDDASIKAAITDAAESGAELIVTASPAMMPRTVRAAIHYDKIRFLNLSLNLSHKKVRTYYARMYEAKFLMGALAASYASDHKIGYLADNPIYGDIARINAFASGAAIVDPEIKVYLEWSTIKGNDWRKSFKEKGISVISGPDYASFAGNYTEQGVFRWDENGEVINLASPLFNWGKYYELIVDSIIKGTYDDDPSVRANQAINYWYGISAGVVDISVSEQVSYYTRKLLGILKHGLKRGSIEPFAGEIHSQHRLIQGKDAKVLSDDEIIRMNWLNDNVIGSIPQKESLDEDTKDIVDVSGVNSDMQKAAKVK